MTRPPIHDLPRPHTFDAVINPLLAQQLLLRARVRIHTLGYSQEQAADRVLTDLCPYELNRIDYEVTGGRWAFAHDIAFEAANRGPLQDDD
jgi:hypothetical protein